MHRFVHPTLLLLVGATVWCATGTPANADVPLGFTATVSELSCMSGQLQFDGYYKNGSSQTATVEYQINGRSYFTFADVSPGAGGGRQFLDRSLRPMGLKAGQPYTLEAKVNGETVAEQSGVTPKCAKALMYIDVSKAQCRNGQPMVDWVAVSRHPQALSYDLYLTEGRKAIPGGSLRPGSKVHGSLNLLKFNKPGEGYSLTWSTGDGGGAPFPATGTVPDCGPRATAYMQMKRTPAIGTAAVPAEGTLVPVTVDAGVWSPMPTDYTVQWIQVKQTFGRNSNGGWIVGPLTFTPIAGATSLTFTPPSRPFAVEKELVRYGLMARVTVSRAGFPDSVSYSKPVNPRFLYPLNQQ